MLEKSHIDFHLAEYSALREQLLVQLKAADTTLIYCITANAAASAWVISNSGESSVSIEILTITSFIPLIVTLLAAALYGRKVLEIHQIGKYSAKIEEMFAFEDMGWEKSFSMRYRINVHKFDFTVEVIFAVLILLSISLIWYVTAR